MKITRSLFLLAFLPALVGLPRLPSQGTQFAARSKAARPNVLFVAIDDLNDWVGCMGGRKRGVVHTPNLDRLAAAGTLFMNAHCAAPACNPSRTAVMYGIRPSTSGVYSNNQPHRLAPRLANAATLVVTIGNIKTDVGQMNVAVYDNEDDWLGDEVVA